ncbi:MAG: hypothetical protein ACP5IX_02060 [Patescibacteria group bacterium]
MPTERIETEDGFDLVPAVKTDPEKFDWQTALKTELTWLEKNEIITGLTDQDLDSIYYVTARGRAGHNRKIIWAKSAETKEYTWLPYDETDNPLLIRAADCGGFLLSMLPKKQLTLISEAGETAPNKIYFWLAMAIQLVISIALIIYCLFLVKKFLNRFSSKL